MPLWARRVALVIISIVLGYVVTRFLVIPVLGTTPSEYAWGPEVIPIPYTFMTSASFAVAFGLIRWNE